MKKLSLYFIALVMVCFYTSAQEKLVVSNWLSTTSFEVPNPVFYANPNTRGKTFNIEEILSFNHFNLNGIFPENEKILGMAEGKELTWESTFTDSNGYVFIDNDTLSTNHQVAYLAVYIWADRFVKTTLELKSPIALRAWVGGELIGTKTTTENDENMVGKVTKSLNLERGKHLLIIKTVRPSGAPRDWKIMANFEIREPYLNTDLSFSLSPTNRKNINHILDGVKASGVELSADGKYYSINYRQSLPPGDQSESWTEIRRLADRKLMQTFRNTRISQLQWLPQSNAISYVVSRDNKSTLYLQNIDNKTISTLVEDIENLVSYRWAPSENFIIYSLRESGSSIDTDLRQVLGMEDRQANFRNRNFLYKFDLASGFHERLTYGNLTTTLQDISPDSRKIVFTQRFPDYNSRTFSFQNCFLLDLETNSIDTLWINEPISVRTTFSPDGKSLLGTAGTAAFGGIGQNLPEGMIANNYENQAYIFDLATKTARSITRDFDPSVISAHWHTTENVIYLHVIDQDYQRIYRYDVRRDRYALVDLGFEYISSVNYARNAHVAAFQGSNSNHYPRVFSVDLRNLKQTLIDDSETQTYAHVEFGEVKNWDFTTTTGLTIKGRVYYPPDFNPEFKYPVIVYFYGGTTPVGRAFGGRYPFNVWAGNGYIVYVLQPSGAIGFGQKFSAAHVNNWGITVADEIIEGTQKFLQAHPYANPSKVGCVGASYGGFMTMLLMTRTDIFAAAISHAGISSISSYWGEGYWGYSYSAEATAGSFPWNRPDIYVGQSPLFHADKVNTPLLLLTGDSDTNVPPGESIQMYTALKILNRPVELVLVKGEDHHILTYGKRIQWHNTIMAWWARYLKDEPQWWENLYPEKNY